MSHELQQNSPPDMKGIKQGIQALGFRQQTDLHNWYKFFLSKRYRAFAKKIED